MSAHLGAAVTAFVDGELDHERRDAVLAHLAHCARCRGEVDALRRVKSALSGADPAVPNDLTTRLLASTPAGSPLPRPHAPRRRSGLVRRTAVGAGVVALGLGGALQAAGPRSVPEVAVDPMAVGHQSSVVTVASQGPEGGRLDELSLQLLEARGWPIPRLLPHGMELVQARLLHREVVQLDYANAASVLTLYLQEGTMNPPTAGLVKSVAGGPVFEASGRWAWSSGGRTWTLVSTAPTTVVNEAVAMLPHRSASVADGMVLRAWRGFSRVGSWFNPFA